MDGACLHSRRAICFTGAGLSTAAGLGDYRGKQGKWTLEAQGLVGGTPLCRPALYAPFDGVGVDPCDLSWQRPVRYLEVGVDGATGRCVRPTLKRSVL